MTGDSGRSDAGAGQGLDARAWGIDEGYHDVNDRWHAVAPDTLAAIAASMGAEPGSVPPPPGALVVGAGRAHRVEGAAEVETEDGASVRVDGALPPDLPPGYHTLVALDDGRRLPLIVSPGRCHLPAGLRTWGWAAQLYATRSQASWGIGDLGDLRRLAAWSAREAGAGFLLLNPLHAGRPVTPASPSPYSPSSRRFRDPLYLRVEGVAGAAGLPEVSEAARAGRALNAKRIIDRDAVLPLKMRALEAIWQRHGRDDPDFGARSATEAADVEAYATYCALCEVHGASWREWPAELRHPAGAAVTRFRQERRDRVRFHAWLQWLLDQQLAAASRELPVMQDLAIGVDPAGADAWLWQDVIAEGVTVGAPPDRFNTLGQNWGLPPFDPWRLRAAGYWPFIQTIRAGLRHAGGLRVDHVMGLFRLFWIPAGAGAADGTYVRYPFSDLLDILALESLRAGAFVVGEDLGTVEMGMREELGSRDILSYRLLWFEDEPPPQYPERALAAVTTHDLPTIAGMWTGDDVEAQRRLGLNPDEAEMEGLVGRLERVTGLDRSAPVEAVVEATYRALAQAPTALLTATLDDVLGVRERPNMPGTESGWPNWSLALPATLEEIEQHPLAARVAGALRRRRGDPGPASD